MKISLLKLWVMWRRFRRTSPRHNEHHLQYIVQIEALMRRANPFAAWTERANWMIDVADWLRHGPRKSSLDENTWRRIKHQRTRFMLDWLDSHRDVRRVVQATLQKTLREAAGPELFCATGLPHEPAFFGELSERIAKMILPKAPSAHELSALFTTMFPDPADADWLTGMDHKTLARLWKLCADDGITHAYSQQIDEALTYLVSMIIAVGISPEFRQRLEPRVPLQATPFMALQRELQKYLMAGAHDEAALRSVRMLVAVCQAQTDRIYAHLDEHGVSVGLVYRVERMRAQLARMARLIDLRSALPGSQLSVPVQALLLDLVEAHHYRSTVRGLISRSFSLLARKMVERNADRGEAYVSRDRGEYLAMFRSACRGGAVSAMTVLVKAAIPAAGVARFFEGAFASLNYAVSFLAISMTGGTLAARQPAITAPALASKMQSLDTADGMRKLIAEIGALLRSQAAAVFGNVAAIIPAMVVVSLAMWLATGSGLMSPDRAHASLNGLSMLGVTPLFAAFTGVLLWLSSLGAGFADNWFALRKMREALAHHRRLVHALGPVRADRLAHWLERNVAGIVGNVSLALLLGMSPVLLQFFGLPLDVRHVTLATGTLAAAGASLGWSVFGTAEFWLAAGGVFLTGILNIGVAFGCALVLALHARDVPVRLRRVVMRAVVRRLIASPRAFLLPERQLATVEVLPERKAPEEQESVKRSRTGQ
ncbi:MAG TPA: site-specific recombinase [Noviherbaspirillum sp.]|uniref:site-specific recombinase n=1 Tax=Noviherbaspirillum sp. TaxID=1926288 RepID=UPI002B46F882|nr:site-specific recombinase [Noviherbaspirillum sp.]HJV86712.1 site-specific recombinase [Noviherbaspirillum sp.]